MLPYLTKLKLKMKLKERLIVVETEVTQLKEIASGTKEILADIQARQRVMQDNLVEIKTRLGQKEKTKDVLIKFGAPILTLILGSFITYVVIK